MLEKFIKYKKNGTNVFYTNYYPKFFLSILKRFDVIKNCDPLLGNQKRIKKKL